MYMLSGNSSWAIPSGHLRVILPIAYTTPLIFGWFRRTARTSSSITCLACHRGNLRTTYEVNGSKTKKKFIVERQVCFRQYVMHFFTLTIHSTFKQRATSEIPGCSFSFVDISNWLSLHYNTESWTCVTFGSMGRNGTFVWTWNRWIHARCVCNDLLGKLKEMQAPEVGFTAIRNIQIWCGQIHNDLSKLEKSFVVPVTRAIVSADVKTLIKLVR